MAGPTCRATGVKEDGDLLHCFTEEYFPENLLFAVQREKAKKSVE
jgi:hypothetical protein